MFSDYKLGEIEEEQIKFSFIQYGRENYQQFMDLYSEVHNYIVYKDDEFSLNFMNQDSIFLDNEWISDKKHEGIEIYRTEYKN